MINLNVGCDFSQEHVNIILELKKFERKCANGIELSSVYGSPGEVNLFGSARPRRREPEQVTKLQFMLNASMLQAEKIKIFITLNSAVPSERDGRSSMFSSLLVEWINEFSPYIDGLVIAHPGVIDFVHKETDIPIIVSTVMNVHGLEQIKFIKERWSKVIKVCPALWRNRDFDWLNEANSIIPIELLANEFCSLGGVECEGLYRQACYINHSTDGNWEPMDVCREERRKHSESWLMAKFILPQWMITYKNSVGVNNFKVTGRTHPASFVEYIGKSYLSGHAKGNLLALWGMLEATYDKVDQEAEQKKALAGRYPYIAIHQIENRHQFFIDSCNSTSCGITCQICKDLYSRILGAEL